MSAGHDSLATALERLALSRERMRQSMIAVMPSAHRAGAPGHLPKWVESLKSVPGASVLIEALGGWWAQHPLRVAGMVGIDAGKTLIRPLAQRHPIGLVVGALLVGGIVVWVKPWRGFIKPALFAGLLPQLISKVLAKVPVQSWMSVFSTLTQASAQPAARSPASPEAPAVQPVPAGKPAVDPSVLH